MIDFVSRAYRYAFKRNKAACLLARMVSVSPWMKASMLDPSSKASSC
jgi:hypothetical protein